jgi:hypothetical protein
MEDPMRTLVGNKNTAIYGAGGTEITDTEYGCTTEEARNLSKVGMKQCLDNRPAIFAG